MYIMGISAFYHDSAACLLKDGKIIAAVQEERFTRKKHDSSFPRHSIQFCIKEAGISPDQISNIVFYEKPFIKFERLIETYLGYVPRGFLSFSKIIPIWIKDKLFQKTKILNELNETIKTKINWRERILFSEHHLSHAASAFFPSPFQNAAVITIDGVGEWTTTSVAIGEGNKLKIIKELHFPHSIGLLYSAFTYYIGYKVNSGEYKVMGLAPYGEPKYVSLIKDKLINIAEDGSYQLDMSYFDYATGFTMTNKKFDKLFGAPPRKPETKLTQRDMDLSASIQKVVKEITIKIAKGIAKDTGKKNLCLAGGVSLNCVINGILLKENFLMKYGFNQQQETLVVHWALRYAYGIFII
jgi:carbamoyltransferase